MPTDYQNGKATEDVRRASDGERHSAVETKARNCQKSLTLVKNASTEICLPTTGKKLVTEAAM